MDCIPVFTLLGDRHCKLGIGLSGISSKIKGAVRWAESQCAVDGGGQSERKGGGDECNIEELKEEKRGRKGEVKSFMLGR